jgi:hypothetical protein
MQQRLLYLALIVLLFVSCEDYYKPDLEVVPGTMVVESRLTTDRAQNFVRLSLTRNFLNNDALEWITGARVELIESGRLIVKAKEVNPGYYTFQHIPSVGKTYVLWILYKNDVYESSPVIMPPLPKIDSLYTRHKIEQKYRVNGYGVPELFNKPGREICVDVPIKQQFPYTLYTCRAIIQWEYYPPSPRVGPPSPPLYGWRTKYDNGVFNLAGPKEFSTSTEVLQHPIQMLAYNTQEYLDSVALIPMNWIVIVDQYGISKESYDFHEKLNKQFLAEGSLFDPVMTQVFGNMHCKNDPGKIALGFFDVRSCRQYRYYFNMGTGPDNQVIQRRLNEYYDISDHGYEIGVRPVFWEDNYS